MRVAMFDPYAENAVVLYTPPPLSAHEMMNMKEEDKLVNLSLVVELLFASVCR